MPTTTRLSTKGQLILPKEMRERHGWEAGTEFSVEERDGTVLIRPLDRLPERTLDEIVGCTGYDGPPRSLQDMDRAVADEARKRR